MQILTDEDISSAVEFYFSTHKEWPKGDTQIARAVETLIVSRFAQAFAAWETAFRDDPTGFMTQEEVAAMEVAPLSEQSAIYFTALMRKVSA